MRRVNKELVKLSGQLLATSVLVSGNYYPKTVTVSRYLSATAHSQRLDEFKKHFSAGIRLVVKMCGSRKLFTVSFSLKILISQKLMSLCLNIYSTDEVRHFVERLLGVARILLKEWVFEVSTLNKGQEFFE